MSCYVLWSSSFSFMYWRHPKKSFRREFCCYAQIRMLAPSNVWRSSRMTLRFTQYFPPKLRIMEILSSFFTWSTLCSSSKCWIVQYDAQAIQNCTQHQCRVNVGSNAWSFKRRLIKTQHFHCSGCWVKCGNVLTDRRIKSIRMQLRHNSLSLLIFMN